MFPAKALLPWILLGGIACDRKAAPPSAGSGFPVTSKATVPEGEIVARIDGEPITRADLDKRLSERSSFVRARYSAPDKRRELLDSVVRFEVLAREAKSRGYDQDPEVVRYQKQRAIERMLATEVDAKLAGASIPRTDLERHYREHLDEYRQQEGVRVDQILVKDQSRAKRIVATARALQPADVDGFRRLVVAHSEDAASKGRGGDVGFLQRGGDQAPPEVTEAAFRLATNQAPIGRIAGPVASPQGFHILRLTQRREAFQRPFEEVEPLVRRQVVAQLRRQRIDALVADMRSRVKVEVFEDRLKEVKVSQLGQDALPDSDATETK